MGVMLGLLYWMVSAWTVRYPYGKKILILSLFMPYVNINTRIVLKGKARCIELLERHRRNPYPLRVGKDF